MAPITRSLKTSTVNERERRPPILKSLVSNFSFTVSCIVNCSQIFEFGGRRAIADACRLHHRISDRPTSMPIRSCVARTRSGWYYAKACVLLLNFLTLLRKRYVWHRLTQKPRCVRNLRWALYARGILGFGKVRELCGLTKWQFEELLGRRKVVRPHDEDDLAVDLAYGRRSQ